MANTIREKELKTSWPCVEGTTAGTTKDWERQINLLPTDGSLVPKRFKKGMMD